ncbi:S1 family peptidase [Agrobacterium tumefaciens]|uniref:S1 family peptidase n=1 Tax=Agrobacterium tumefaciens TaxID=358 RepID=UPI003BA13878
MKLPWLEIFKRKRAESPPVVLPPLEGTDDNAFYQITDDSGNVLDDASRMVVPLFSYPTKPGDPVRMLGTGFFIAPRLIATAKHVVDEVLDRTAPDGLVRQKSALMTMVRRSNSSAFEERRIHIVSTVDGCDVAVCQVDAGSRCEKCAPLRISKAEVGETVFTFAFPNTEIVDRDGKHVLVTNPAFYRGEVVEYYPEGRDKYLLSWPLYHVDFHMHPGASGGPVFDRSGFVIGINCASMEPERSIAYVTDIENVKHAVVSNVTYGNKPPMNMTIGEMIKNSYIDPFPQLKGKAVFKHVNKINLL